MSWLPIASYLYDVRWLEGSVDAEQAGLALNRGVAPRDFQRQGRMKAVL
jgi:hypothetical protein